MPLLKTKLTNQISKLISKENLKFSLQNININGQKRGCSGHITYIPTGRCIYVNTEPLITDRTKLLYRFAKDETDYSSQHNDFAAYNQFTTETNFATAVAQALLMDRNKISTITTDKINYQ